MRGRFVWILVAKSQLIAHNSCTTCNCIGQSADHGSASDRCFPLVLLPDASVTCSPTISDKWRFEITGTSVYTLSVGLLQCFAGRNNWHSIKTAAVSTEYCGPFGVWSTTAGPHHSSPTQPPLASGAAKDLFQDCGPRMEKHPWRRTSISARSLRAGGESSRTFSTPVGIDWMCRPAKSTDVGGPAQLRLPRAHSVEQSAISTAWQQPVTEHVQEAAEDVSVWTVMNATRRRCDVSCDSGAGYKCHDLLTYLRQVERIFILSNNSS